MKAEATNNEATMKSKFNKNQKRRFIEYYLNASNREDCGVSSSESRIFRTFAKKTEFLVDGLNRFEAETVYRRYFDGEYLADARAFGVFLVMGGHETRLSSVLDAMGIADYHYETAKSLCLGLAAMFQDRFVVSFTHDLEKIVVR